MTRLPTPGKDSGTWGDILNDYLSQSHKTDGSLKDNTVGASQLKDNAVGPSQLATNAVTASAIADSTITSSQLATDITDKLDKANTALQPGDATTTATPDKIPVRDASGEIAAAPATDPGHVVTLGQGDGRYATTAEVASQIADPNSELGAALSSTYVTGVGLKSLGLSDSTPDIKTIFDAAVAAGIRHVVVPYRAAAWPALTKIILADMWVEFEAGARISFNHAAQGAELTRVRLTRASFTSTFTGPASVADATSAAYGYPAREVKINDGCTIDGGYYQEYATSGLHITGSGIRYVGPVTIKHIRHQQGWGNAVHHDGIGCYDVRGTGPWHVEDCDRAFETEEGAHDVTISGGGLIKDVFPKGYAGQGSAATYANYTFILDAHSHEGAGGAQGITYDGSWLIQNCGGGVSFIRSTGTNDSDLPRNCRVGDVRFVGRGMATGYEDIAIQGRNNHVGRAHFEVGAGIEGGSFKIKGYPDSKANSVGAVLVEGAATPTVTDAGTGLLVGSSLSQMPEALRSGRFERIPNRTISTNNAFANGTLRTTPVYIPYRQTIDQIGTEVTAAGDAGCVLRIGIYSDANGLPGSPLVDVTVAADAIGTPMATLLTPLTLEAGWYHVGGVLQGVTTTQPTFRAHQVADDRYPIFNPTLTAVAPVGYSKTGVLGALPVWGTGFATTNYAPSLWVRHV